MMVFAIVYDRNLKTYKTCLLDDAEGCDVLVQFNAMSFDDALKFSSDYFENSTIDREEIAYRESLNAYKKKAKTDVKEDDKLPDLPSSSTVASQTPIQQEINLADQEIEDELIRRLNRR